MYQRVASVFVLALFLTCGRLTAAEPDGQRLPPRLRVAILFKALSYDKNLKRRCGSSVRVGVLHGSSESDRRDARSVVEEIQSHARPKINEMPIKVVDLEAHDRAGIQTALTESGANTVYLGAGLDHLLPVIRVMASRHNIALVTGEAGYLTKGASLGAVLQNTKPKILVHSANAREQGLDFDARLLRLAEVVHDSP